MIFVGSNAAEKNALRVANHRGQLSSLGRGVYTDTDIEDPNELIRANALAITGRLLPSWHLAHSSAATLAPTGNFLFVSSRAAYSSSIALPGLKIMRLSDLVAPEIDWIESPTKIQSGLSSHPEKVRIQVSSPLQTIYECMMPSRVYPERNISEALLESLIENLSYFDRERAQAFAVRNGLQAEYWRLAKMMEAKSFRSLVRIPPRREVVMFFYGWEVGRLKDLSGEFRFEYSPNWLAPLSTQLPVTAGAYEGRNMPAFFDNLLPEGWMESQLQATFKISKEDTMALLATSNKYLSNITLRPANLDAKEVVFDCLDEKLEKFAPVAHQLLLVDDQIVKHKSVSEVLRSFGAAGPMRVSGVQAKLPVSLSAQKDILVLNLGVLGNSCGHIIKYQSPSFPFVVENEWATMQLARTAGLNVATVRMVSSLNDEFDLMQGRALLIERYDVPSKRQLAKSDATLKLALQEDAASLLGISRKNKYDTSAEKIASALLEVGLSKFDLDKFLEHLIFSWLIGNGDMHAKNISVVRWFEPGRLGDFPRVKEVSYSPLYDLVNTKVYFAKETFAFTVNGKRDKLRTQDFYAVAKRWGRTKEEVTQTVKRIGESIQTNLDAVLPISGLPSKQQKEYRLVVEEKIRTVF